MRKLVVEKKLNEFIEFEKKLENLNIACRILNFDMQTKCATKALEEQAASITEVLMKSMRY